MFKITVITPMVYKDLNYGNGLTRMGFTGEIAEDYTVPFCGDITIQPASNLPTDPAIYTAIVICDQATLNAIEADIKYQVLSSEEIIDETI